MVIHCVKCGVIGLTNSKKQILDYEYNGFQWHMIFGGNVDILTQHKRANEYNGSITCHRCGNIDKKQRKSQGLFSCSHCGLQYNADLNGAMNNLNRAKEQDFLAGAISEARKPLSEGVIG